jgi:20S proteasome alpha/beta subunit
VTIALGFKCLDGIVLGADQQITKEGGLKYTEGKLRWFTPDGEPYGWAVGLAYAGNPDQMKLFVENAAREIKTLKPQPTVAAIRKAVEDVLRSMAEDNDEMNLELLLGISIQNEPDTLLVTKNKLVREAKEPQCLGVGDSSLLRYLAEMMCSLDMSTQYALQIAIYMIQHAKKFVDNCGGGTDLYVVTNGTIVPYMGLLVERCEKFMSAAESQVKRLIQLYLDPRYSNEAAFHSMDGIAKGLKNIRSNVSQI